MINWFVFYYIALGTTIALFFNIVTMLTINLPIVGALRALYIFGFYLNYVKHAERDTNIKNVHLFSKKEKYYFGIKNCVIIFLGFLNIYLALFFGVYSMMITAFYFKNVAKRIEKRKKMFEVIGKALYIVAPFVLIIAFILIDILAIIPILLGIVLFLYRGQTLGNFTIKELFERFDRRIFHRMATSQKKVFRALRFTVMGFLVFSVGFNVLFLTLWGFPVKEDFMVEMRDHKELATTVYYSPLVGKNKAPIVLIRTPYDKSALGMDYYAALYLNQGYHVVFQDMRNTGASEGFKSDLLFATCYKDGVDTIKWILDQSWCNGKIASVGASALAINQYFYAGMKGAYDGEDGLKAQSIWFSVPDLYLDGIMEGCFRYDLVVNWIQATAPDNWRYQLDTIFDLIDSKNLSSPEYQATTLNGETTKWENINVRSLFVAGWYDCFLGGSLRGYMGYNENGTKYARDHQKLIVGPWTHVAVYTTQQGELNYPSNSIGITNILDWESQILDEGLRGVEKDIWDQDRVAYYLMGDVDDSNADANYWKYAEDWPLDYNWNKWYFGVDEDGDHVVVDDDSDLAGLENITYSYDPRDPCPTIGGNNLGGNPGPRDQSLIEERDDVIVFTSEELEEPYTIEGDLKVQLFFSSDCNDTDFIVRLCDVYPDGRSMLIIDGARMARLRESMYSEAFITPGNEYNMTINLFSTAYQFNEGHRIRISVTSSNYPRFAINPNTGGSITESYTRSKVAENTIITGPGKSCIYFPELND